MPGNRETERRRRAAARKAQREAMRQTVREVHTEAVIAGLTDPGELEDFIVGALQLEWPALSDDAARDIARRFLPK